MQGRYILVVGLKKYHLLVTWHTTENRRYLYFNLSPHNLTNTLVFQVLEIVCQWKKDSKFHSTPTWRGIKIFSILVSRN